jgi:hypothetical protein
MDIDGHTHTALLLILLTPRGPSSCKVETDICRMVELMLSICPSCGSITPNLPRPTLFYDFSPSALVHANNEGIAPTPLYYALLTGRSLEAAQLLIQNTSQPQPTGCSMIVNQYHEAPLHIAITTRAPLSIIYHLAKDSPQAVLVQDIFGLSSIDWLWIRHVLDWHSSPLDLTTSRIVTRRRFLANQFCEWHKMATDNLPLGEHMLLPVNPVAVRGLQEDLLHRMKLLLPLAAAVLSNESTTNEQWSLIHAACLVPCPIAMVRAALTLCGDSRLAIRSKDMRAGRYPLHYAAGRMGYSAIVPLGLTRKVHLIQEESPLLSVLQFFPDACKERDASGQLPIHIYLDACKQYRSASHSAPECLSYAEEHGILKIMISHYPGSLDQPDGKTDLFLWQQAAVGPGSNLTTIFELLRIHPTMLTVQSTVTN